MDCPKPLVDKFLEDFAVAEKITVEKINDKLCNALYLPIYGGLIDDRVKEIVEIANEKKVAVFTVFNDIGIVANPGDKMEELISRWEVTERRLRSA